MTALHYAAFNGHSSTAEMLVKHGTNVNVVDAVS